MFTLPKIKLVFSTIFTTLIYLIGGWDIAIQSLIIVIILDYLTGMGKSYVSSTLNSNKGLKGIVKKLGILCMVAVSQVVDNLLSMNGVVRTFIVYYLVANEGLSILENLGAMGIVVPQFLIDRLEQLKEGEEDELSD